MGTTPTIRCAIYTRKSSEEGLDQGFNSLDAQYDACQAYIASQKQEGWILAKDRFDDGGVSGGTLERPALHRLLAEIDAGRIRMVVVYKIDRLTRSLADFARLVERFETAGCSFVSVTQSFNTASSMGRLTLNVLLSFAQFEREVTAERIRDKIAASKKKGLWMGGVPPLGYDPPVDPRVRALALNPQEAGTVRILFDLCDRGGGLAVVERVAAAQGLRSKCHQFRSGRTQGGNPLSRGQIHKILTNPVYIGKKEDKPLLLRALLEGGSLREGMLDLTLDRAAIADRLAIPPESLACDVLSLSVPFSLRRRGVEQKLVAGSRAAAPDPALRKALADAHRWAKALRGGTPLHEIARAAGHHDAHIRTRTPLAFLSPRIQRAILDGTQPVELTLERLVRQTLPLDWSDQERLCGL